MLLRSGQLANVKTDMDRLAVDFPGLAEVRWRWSDMITSGEHVVNYSGLQDESRSGVGLLMER